MNYYLIFVKHMLCFVIILCSTQMLMGFWFLLLTRKERPLGLIVLNTALLAAALAALYTIH